MVAKIVNDYSLEPRPIEKRGVRLAASGKGFFNRRVAVRQAPASRSIGS